MPRVAESFDPQSIEWRHITDPNEKALLIDFEYSLLGYDAENGRLDMLLRFPDNGGHCRRHRHWLVRGIRPNINAHIPAVPLPLLHRVHLRVAVVLRARNPT